MPPAAMRSQGGLPASGVNRGQNLLNNKYTMLEPVGHGAYGNVFKGRDVTTGEVIAIKEVKLMGSTQEDVQDMMSEIDLLKSLNHEHIVQYLDSFKTRTHLYIILEFMEKGDLASALKPTKFGVFPEALAAVYIAQVLKGLVYLHEQGVVHRDIKGANILTTEEGLVKLADFGVATNLSEGGGNGGGGGNSGVQDVVGTPYWMAPEVIEMTGVTAGSDVWSVGCLVVELLTGHPPYYELQPMSALFRIVQDSHPPLPEVISPHMEDFLLQCFQKEARQRPDARTLLGHPWICTNTKRNIRATWGRTQGTRGRGGNGAYESVSSVMNRILQTGAEGDEEEEADPGSAVATIHYAPGGAADRDQAGAQHGSPARPPVDQGVARALQMSPAGHRRAYSSSASTTMAVDSGFGTVTVNPLLSRAMANNPAVLRAQEQGMGPWGAVNSSDVLAPEDLLHSVVDGDGTPQRGPSSARRESLEARSPMGFQHYGTAPPGGGGLLDRGRIADSPGAAGGEEWGQSPQVQHPRSVAPQGVSRILWGADGGRQGTPVQQQQQPQHVDLLVWALGGGATGTDAPPGALGAAAGPGRTPMSTRRPVQPPGGHMGMGPGPLDPMNDRMSSPGMHGGDQDRLAERRREKDEIRRLISSLTLEAAAREEAKVLGACQQLTALLPDSGERKAVFLDNSGPVGAMELLDSGSPRLVEAALELINSVASNDAGVLEALGLVGMLPAVTKFAESSASSPLARQQAALFMQKFCFTAPRTQQMLIACNGLPVLVRLVEDDYREHRDLVYSGVSCVWHILEVHGPGRRMNDFCRVLAHAGLLERLVSSLSSASQDLEQSPPRACRSVISMAGGGHSRNPSTASVSGALGGGLTPRDTDASNHSNTQASERRRSHTRASSSDQAGAELRLTNSATGPPSPSPSNQSRSRRRGNGASAGSEAEVSSILEGDAQVFHDPTPLLDKTANLLLVFSIADSVVKRHLCRRETLSLLFDTVPSLDALTALKVLRSIKHLTMDENMLAMLQGHEIIRRLVVLLDSLVNDGSGPSPASSPPSATNMGSQFKIAASGEEHQLEVLHALYNLCRINKQCQETAAIEGAVHSLCTLARRPPDSNAKLRTMAISMLCRLAHTSSASRGKLWQAGGLPIFLQLTSEPRWQAPAMDAIATWLAEDLVRIEPPLLQPKSLQTVTGVFGTWKQQLTERTNVGELKGLLEIFHRILATSRRLNVALSSGALPALAVAMLREELPMTSLPLLKILRSLYEAHPHPKDFIIQHKIHAAVRSLAEADARAALVAKQAQNLLDAFQINSIL